MTTFLNQGGKTASGKIYKVNFAGCCFSQTLARGIVIPPIALHEFNNITALDAIRRDPFSFPGGILLRKLIMKIMSTAPMCPFRQKNSCNLLYLRARRV